MVTKVLDQHIEITPGIAGGKPRVAGHRITVQNIAIWHERMGKEADEIAAEYDVTLADVYAALASTLTTALRSTEPSKKVRPSWKHCGSAALPSSS